MPITTAITTTTATAISSGTTTIAITTTTTTAAAGEWERGASVSHCTCPDVAPRTPTTRGRAHSTGGCAWMLPCSATSSYATTPTTAEMGGVWWGRPGCCDHAIPCALKRAFDDTCHAVVAAAAAPTVATVSRGSTCTETVATACTAILTITAPTTTATSSWCGVSAGSPQRRVRRGKRRLAPRQPRVGGGALEHSHAVNRRCALEGVAAVDFHGLVTDTFVKPAGGESKGDAASGEVTTGRKQHRGTLCVWYVCGGGGSRIVLRLHQLPAHFGICSGSGARHWGGEATTTTTIISTTATTATVSTTATTLAAGITSNMTITTTITNATMTITMAITTATATTITCNMGTAITTTTTTSYHRTATTTT